MDFWSTKFSGTNELEMYEIVWIKFIYNKIIVILKLVPPSVFFTFLCQIPTGGTISFQIGYS